MTNQLQEAAVKAKKKSWFMYSWALQILGQGLHPDQTAHHSKLDHIYHITCNICRNIFSYVWVLWHDCMFLNTYISACDTLIVRLQGAMCVYLCVCVSMCVCTAVVSVCVCSLWSNHLNRKFLSRTRVLICYGQFDVTLKTFIYLAALPDLRPYVKFIHGYLITLTYGIMAPFFKSLYT